MHISIRNSFRQLDFLEFLVSSKSRGVSALCWCPSNCNKVSCWSSLGERGFVSVHNSGSCIQWQTFEELYLPSGTESKEWRMPGLSTLSFSSSRAQHMAGVVTVEVGPSASVKRFRKSLKVAYRPAYSLGKSSLTLFPGDYTFYQFDK